MDKAVYCDDEHWSGSYYGLCLELGDCGDDERVYKALNALWMNERLAGPWRTRHDVNMPAITVTQGVDDGTLYGVARLTSGHELGVLSILVRVSDESDWLNLSIPVGMLEWCYPVKYPLQYRTNPWMEDVDQFLVEIGAALYQHIPFRLGMIGEEVSGYVTAADLSPEECARGGFLVPAPLWQTLKMDCPHQQFDSGLYYISYTGTHIAFGGEASVSDIS